MADRLHRLHDPLPASHNWSCGYGANADAARCDAEAVWHGIILTEDRADIIAMASSCDAHRPFLALSTEFIHPHGSACGIGGATAWWDTDEDPNSGCKIDWETSGLALLAAEPEMAGVCGA